MSVWGNIAFYSFIGCLGMFLQDSVGTIMVKAIGAGRPLLAGSMDALADIAKITILSISGVELTHQFGWRGFVGIIPIIAVGFATTAVSTHYSNRFVVDEDDENHETVQESRLAALEAKVEQFGKSTQAP